MPRRNDKSEVDFGRAAADYGTHRRGFPDKFFERMMSSHVVHHGQLLLDLGSGTGTIARGFYRRGCQVVALDPKLPLLREGIKLDNAEGTRTNRVIGVAEALPFPEGNFDTVIAGQCWHWFDRPLAASEAKRVLKPGGHLIIAHFDWLPLPGNVVDMTEKLILKHNPAWGMANGNGIYPLWYSDIAIAGFDDIESFTADVQVSYTHESWRGRIRASAGVGAGMTPVEVETFDHDLAYNLRTRFPDEPLNVPHRIFAIWCRKSK